ncbi:unnamed protein product [Cylicocyclus nassatus]|uniref:Uncharacterized protein n=1 Tax=Cylicocyclus nassatus TaxID=53992 RepID=A0AA36GLX8_CYLNA|nr:unnamed protein product [Cylicocyclus nassatus]
MSAAAPESGRGGTRYDEKNFTLGLNSLLSRGACASSAHEHERAPRSARAFVNGEKRRRSAAAANDSSPKTYHLAASTERNGNLSPVQHSDDDVAQSFTKVIKVG